MFSPFVSPAMFYLLPMHFLFLVRCVGTRLLCLRNDNTQTRFQCQRYEFSGLQDFEGKGKYC